MVSEYMNMDEVVAMAKVSQPKGWRRQRHLYANMRRFCVLTLRQTSDSQVRSRGAGIRFFAARSQARL